MMDAKLLKTIICSSESATQSLSETDLKKLTDDNNVTINYPAVFDALCASLTKLLCHTVSKEAYQRYSVRLHIIELLRDWCKISTDFDCFEGFTNEKKTLMLLQKILEKYLTDDTLDYCDNSDDLVQLTNALLYLASKEAVYVSYAEKLLIKLSRLELSSDAEQLLFDNIGKGSSLTFQLATIEEIYISQREKLIEQPLLAKFQASSILLSSVNVNKDSNNRSSLDELLNVTTKSAKLFLCVCTFLKDIFVQLQYAPVALNFLGSIIQEIKQRCKENKNDILDLYPKNLQSVIFLLRIDPELHTKCSRAITFGMLKEILSEDKDSAIILLSHFPSWLVEFANYFSSSADTY